MNYLLWLLFSFQGRIGRGTYWSFFFASLALVFVVFNLTVDKAALQAYMAMVEEISLLTQSGDQAGAEALAQQLPPIPIPTAFHVVTMMLLWPTLAVQAKRFRDRGRPVALVALNLLAFSSLILGGFGIMLHLSAQIWILIECGFLPSRHLPPTDPDKQDTATFEG